MRPRPATADRSRHARVLTGAQAAVVCGMVTLFAHGGCHERPGAPEPQPETANATTPSAPRRIAPTHAEPLTGTLYVPAYSHIAAGANRTTQLRITLSVRNVDPAVPVTLHYVDYYDTPGHRVRSYLSSPTVLRPLATVEYVVALFDKAGGSGANFLVGWSASQHARPLLAETIMVGQAGTGYLSFTSRGVEVGAHDLEPEPKNGPSPGEPLAP